MKLWAGRFAGETDGEASDFNASLRFDSRLFRQDIAGSVAHAGMLGRQGIIAAEDAESMIKGLGGILADLESGALAFDGEAEDIHSFVEAELTRRIGAAGGRLHTGRSRNDQVATDLRLYLKDEVPAVLARILLLMEMLCGKAAGHLRTVMPGYTHLQRAQPVTLAHVLMAYAEMFRRDAARLIDCYERLDCCPLGAGALAGVTYPIDREATARALGFARLCPNSLDAVGDRDFCIELCADLSMLMMHLSRLSEEVILWCSAEFGFMELSDAYSTGSSIMPQKKNPDVAELARGKTGRVYGSLVTLLTVMKGLPLAYNKDMQEDKEAVFDALDTANMTLSVFSKMLDTAAFRPERMRQAASGGFINATDCADYLTKKGVPFREAYGAVGRLVACCLEKACTLETLPLEEYRAQHPAFSEDIYAAIALDSCLDARATPGGPSPESVEAHRQEILRFIKTATAVSAE